MPNQMTFNCNTLFKSVGVAAMLVGFLASDGSAETYGSNQSNSGSIDGFSGREVVRRQQDTVEAEGLEKAGDAAMRDRDLETAYTNYLDALDLVGSGEAVDGQRARLLGKFSNTGVSY
ncbi:MAG: hypothetical protein ACOVMP_02535, partial [Chthoniobacterales bacterium]